MTRFSVGVPMVLTLASLVLVGCPRAMMEATPAELAFTVDEATKTLTVTNTSTGRITLDFTVTTDQPWLTVNAQDELTFTLTNVAGENSQALTVAVAYAKASFSEGTVTVAAKTAKGKDLEPIEVAVTTGVAQYFTEPFDQDLEGKMVIFSEVDTPAFYTSEIAALPSGVDANMRVNLEEYFPVFFPSLDPVEVPLLDDMKVWLYGQEYGSVFLGSDGRVAFENTTPAAAADADALLAGHFADAGVSALYTPLTIDGEVYAFQFDDRLLVVYNGMPAVDGVDSSNSFQAEFFFEEAAAEGEGEGEGEGEKAASGVERGVALSWFDVDDTITAVVGLSAGGETAVPADYAATDLIAQSTVTDNTYPLPVE